MDSSLVPERLDVVVLWRLASTPRATNAELRKALAGFGDALDGEAARARLEGRGLVHERAVTEAGVRELGGARPAGEAWSASVLARRLPLHALGLAPDLVPAKDGGWPALVLARHFGLFDGRGKPPSLPGLTKLLVWRRLGLTGEPAKQIPAPIARAVLAGLGADGELKRLARQLVGVANADPAAFRKAIVKTWLAGRDFTRAAASVEVLAGIAPGAATLAPRAAETESLEDFARRVRDAAAHAESGVFGDRKVLISALFRELGARAGVPDLEAFKHLLVEANRRGLVHLHRADFPEGLDESEVAASATSYMHTVFHFVERQETP
jgi:hypothetical protein